MNLLSLIKNRLLLSLKSMGKRQEKRILFVRLVFYLLFLVIISKAFKIQVYDKEALLERGRNQIWREITLYPRRGNILDRNANPLAINIQTYSIFTIPKDLKGDHTSYKALARIIPSFTYRKILSKIKNRKRYTWLARKIPLDEGQVEQIKDLKGIYIEAVPKRVYPNGKLLAQVLGFVGIDNVGLSGVEYLFDDKLRGTPRILRYIKDAKGRPVKFERYFQDNENHDLTLSIDKDIQSIVEKYLQEAVLENNADGGGVGIMDVDSGEILALANYPTYNPNRWELSEVAHRKLPFVTDPIEPGSTFKILAVASALESRTAHPETSFYCEKGELALEGHIIREAEGKTNFEWLSLRDIVKYSSNIGITKVVFDLTYGKFYQTLRSFNIGEETGIEIPGESRGIFSYEKGISPLRLSNISFGQGVAATGIQMLAVYGSIASGGTYITPTIIKGKFRQKRVVLSEETANILEEMLVEAVEEGTGTNAKVSYFTIAGKTGTAQRPDTGGGYRGYISSFVGYPVNVSNGFVAYVYIDNPKGKHYYGNSVAAPVFKKIAQYVLYKDKNFSKMANIEKEGKNLDHIDLAQESVKKFDEGQVPNFLGLDKKNTKRIAQDLKLNIINQGIGIVIKQYPGPGIEIREDTVVNLTYGPPKND